MNTNDTHNLTNRIEALLVESLRVPPDQITPELAFGDLPQWDSMGHMEVMMALEAQFGIEINADTITTLTSVPAITNYLQENGHA
jgi:acyl carrier protein